MIKGLSLLTIPVKLLRVGSGRCYQSVLVRLSSLVYEIDFPHSPWEVERDEPSSKIPRRTCSD